MSSPENPWTTLSSETVYENPWISVTHYEVLNPAGGPGLYGVVRFKNCAVGVVPVDADGFIHLVGQYRYPLGQYSWELPEGGAPLGSDPLEHAKRELLEETGLESSDWRPILEMHLSNSVTTEHSRCYLALDVRRTAPPSPDEDEDLKHRTIPFSEALEEIWRGKITDAITVAGLLKLHAIMIRGELPSATLDALRRT